MKKLLFILLALPMFATAQEKSVQVPTCLAGNAFTIKIPVKFPDSMTVQYAWYRNDTLIEDSHMLLLGEKTIAYTIPANKAYGSSVYYFKYLLHDEYDGKWSRSPRYMVNFLSCPAINASGAISSVAAYSCSGGVSGAGAISSIDAYSCSGGVSGAGAISSIDVVSCSGGVSSAGTISSITAAN